jgi:hypothetical protein
LTKEQYQRQLNSSKTGVRLPLSPVPLKLERVAEHSVVTLVTVFRFCRRARFSPNAALKLLHATLTWRNSSSLRTLTPAAIPSVYLSNPLFFFHPDLIDRFGRPCAVLNLKHVQRTEDGKLDALKDLSKLGWEIGRRWLSDLSRSRKGQEPTLQMVVIVDLDQAGMSNLVSLFLASVSLVARFTELQCRRKWNCCPSSWICSKATFLEWSERVSFACLPSICVESLTPSFYSLRAELWLGLCRNVAVSETSAAKHRSRTNLVPEQTRASRIL